MAAITNDSRFGSTGRSVVLLTPVSWRPARERVALALCHAAALWQQPQISVRFTRISLLIFNALRVLTGRVISGGYRVFHTLYEVRQRCIDLDLWDLKIGSIGNAVRRNPMLRHHIDGSIPGSNQPAIAQELNHGQGI